MKIASDGGTRFALSEGMENQKTLPKPAGKVVNFDQLHSFQQAQDYALGGYHASLERAGRDAGAHARLWQDAAEAYRAAYLAMFPLASLPPAEGFDKAKDLLGDANHKADVAAATAKA